MDLVIAALTFVLSLLGFRGMGGAIRNAVNGLKCKILELTPKIMAALGQGGAAGILAVFTVVLSELGVGEVIGAILDNLDFWSSVSIAVALLAQIAVTVATGGSSLVANALAAFASSVALGVAIANAIDKCSRRRLGSLAAAALQGIPAP